MNYQLIRSNRKTIALQINQDGELIVKAPLRATAGQIEELISAKQKWIDRIRAKVLKQAELARQSGGQLTFEDIRALAEQAGIVIPERAAFYAAKLGVNYGRITIRNQKSKWGSCSSKGNLNFNCLLLLAPPEVLDSIVVHELCHIKEMNHSDRFYAEVLRVFPDYWECQKWLKEYGPVLMKRAGM